jgi:hypothetical protein
MSQQIEIRRCSDGSIDYGHYRQAAQRLRHRTIRDYMRRSVGAVARLAGFGRVPSAARTIRHTAVPQSAVV